MVVNPLANKTSSKIITMHRPNQMVGTVVEERMEDGAVAVTLVSEVGAVSTQVGTMANLRTPIPTTRTETSFVLESSFRFTQRPKGQEMQIEVDNRHGLSFWK